MLNTNSGLWQLPANGADAETGDAWGIGSLMETQARLWNHMLDANRTVWEFYLPWLASGPSLWNAALAPLERDDALEEPEQTVDGVPDVMEAQARQWNQFLDANRSFWTAFGWPLPLGGMTGSANGADAPGATPPPRRTAPRKSARSGRAR